MEESGEEREDVEREQKVTLSPPPSGCEDVLSSPWFAVEWNSACHYYGAVAKQDIPPLTLIWTEQPILHGSKIWNVMAARSNRKFPRNHDEDDDYLRTVCGLTYQERKRFWHMHDQFNDDNKRIWGIILTNSFCNRDLDMEPTCLFVVAKAFNHACAPNVGFDFAGTTQRLWTTRRVPAGEELTICYHDVVYHHPAPVRQAFLQHKYKFPCACQACARTDTNASDTRRRRIAQLACCLSKTLPGAWFLYNDAFEDEIRRVAMQKGQPPHIFEAEEECALGDTGTSAHVSLDVVLDRLLEYIDLVQQEGIDHDLLECYELAFDTAMAAHQTKKADELGKICLERFHLQKGPGHAATKAFRVKWHTRPRHLDGDS
eukprot:scaffold10368_cov180-Amphora_coffeaeformis.AAC.1